MAYEVFDDAPLGIDALVPMFESPDPTVSLVSPFLAVPESNTVDIPSFDFKFNIPQSSIAGVGYINTDSLTEAALRVTGFEEVTPDSVKVKFVRSAGTPFEIEVGADVADQLAKGVYVVRPELLARKHFFGFGRAEITFEPDPDQEVWAADVMIPALRLHRPKRTGCSAELTIESGRGMSANATIEALGMGGGGGAKWSTTLSTSYLARSRCIEVCHPAKMRTVWGKTLFNGTEISYGARVSVMEVDQNTVERGIPANVDGCNQPSSTIESTQRATELMDRRQSRKGETRDIDLSLNLESSAKVKIGLGGGKIPINLSVDLTRSTTRTMTIRTTLEAGARYMSYSPSKRGTLELCWTTK